MLIIKFCVILSLVAVGYFWHKSEVKIAVKESVQIIEIKAKEQTLKIQEERNQIVERMQEINQENDEKSKKDLNDANVKYNAIIAGLQQRTNHNDNKGSSNSTSTTKDRSTRTQETVSGKDSDVSRWKTGELADVPIDTFSLDFTTATGKNLSKEDAIWLTNEAMRAEKIRINLIQCYADYDSVRQLLIEYKSK